MNTLTTGTTGTSKAPGTFASWRGGSGERETTSPERRKPMKAIVQDTYGKADALAHRGIDKPVQDTYGSADVQTAAGGTR